MRANMGCSARLSKAENRLADAVLVIVWFMPEVLSTFQLQHGDVAPDFSLPDANGKIFSRSDVAGPNGLLVVFACNHCPFVVYLANALGQFARDVAAEGVHTVAINPNDAERYPQDAPEHMLKFAQQHRWDFPYLIDESQEVAMAYGAACTPDFFLLDAAGRIAAQLRMDTLPDLKLDDLQWGLVPDGHETGKPKPVFPKIVIEEA